MLHEQALEILQEQICMYGLEMNKTTKRRLETVEEIKTTSFEPRKEVLTALANALWDREQELSASTLSVAASITELEDAQDRANNE